MSIVRICDRCHTVIPEGAKVWQAGLWEAGKEPDKDPQKDYCEACSKSIFAAMAELPAPAREKETKAPVKKIDVPGMKALRDAGWSLKAIAQEHGVSEPTVSRYLRGEG